MEKRFEFKAVVERMENTLRENGAYEDEKCTDGAANTILAVMRQNNFPTLWMLYRFAERYGVSLDWLLGRTEKYWL